MSDFSVNTKTLHSVSGDFNDISQQVQSIANEAKSILSRTRNSISIKLAQSNKTNAVYSSVSNCSADMKNVSSALRQVAEIYNQYENTIKNKESIPAVNIKSSIKAVSLPEDRKDLGDYFWDLMEKTGLFGQTVSVVRKGAKVISSLEVTDFLKFVKSGKGAVKKYLKTYKDIKLFKNFKAPKGTITSIWGKKFFGLDNYFKTNDIYVSGSTKSSTRWYNNFQKVKDAELKDMAKKGFVLDTALTASINAFTNYKEYKSGNISAGRAVLETITETAIDVGKDAIINIGVGTVMATVCANPSVLAVAAVTWAVSLGLDHLTKAFSDGKYDSFTEMASDTVIDLSKKALDGAVNCYNKAKDGAKAAWRKIKSIF